MLLPGPPAGSLYLNLIGVGFIWVFSSHISLFDCFGTALGGEVLARHLRHLLNVLS